jgi:hypothetical protein
MKYYKIYMRDLTFREGWNFTRSPSVIFPWVVKLLRLSNVPTPKD